jgi:hypothetical protein
LNERLKVVGKDLFLNDIGVRAREEFHQRRARVVLALATRTRITEGNHGGANPSLHLNACRV